MIHYIIARRDLDPDLIGYKKDWLCGDFGSVLGITAAQVTHAAGESFAQWANVPSNRTRLAHFGIPTGTIACVLGVPNERRLKAIEKKLIAEGIKHVAIREPDAPWNGRLMTIGLYPSERTPAITRVLGRLKLL
jgi:peptidyl-tRNA hydrolase